MTTAFRKDKGFFWFRIFGYGLLVKDLAQHEMIFSERIGKATFIKIGKYLIRPLKP